MQTVILQKNRNLLHFPAKSKNEFFPKKSYRLLLKNGHLFLSIFQKPLPLYFSVFYGGLFL
jgi:hypothetical protein